MKTKKRFSKLTAWVLTLAMMMTFIPSLSLTAFAGTAGKPCSWCGDTTSGWEYQITGLGTHYMECKKCTSFTWEQCKETSVLIKATCEEYAHYLITCSVCKGSYTKTYVGLDRDPLGHLPGEAATCTTNQVCTREDCGKVLVKAYHNWEKLKASEYYDENGKCKECEAKAAAKVVVNEETTYYATVGKAVEAAENTEATIIHLQNDITDEYINIPNDVILDLNGFDIADSANMEVAQGGKLTLTGNGSIGSIIVKGEMTVQDGADCSVTDTVSIENGGIANINSGSFGEIDVTGDASKLVVSGGTIDNINIFMNEGENPIVDLRGVSSGEYTLEASSSATIGTHIILPQGWALYDENDAIITGTTVAARTTVKAKLQWNYIVYFNSNGGYCETDLAVTVDGKIAELPTPIYNGYVFNGWFDVANGGNKITTETVFTSNTTIYAQFTEKETIVIDTTPQTYTYDNTIKAFEIKDTTPDDFDITYKQGENVVENPTNAGSYDVIITRAEDDTYKSYIETIANGLVINPATIDTAISLTAPIKNTAPQTAITGRGYTATVVWSPEITDTFAYSTEYTATVTIAVDENYTVTGIAENGYTVDGAKTVTNAADSNVITVTYEKTGSRPSSGGGTTRYTVKFDTDGGSNVASKTIARNSKVAEPTAPTKDGYTFNGWYTDKELTEKYDFDSKVTKGFTLYAKWDKHDDEDVDSNTGKPDDKKDDNVDDKTDTSVWENPFEDVKADDWYYENVEYAVENGLFNGTTETTFAPNGIITRAMMVTVLYRAENEPTVTDTATFEDVDSDAYYANAVVWGQQNGIIKGYSETEFAPDQNITREQIAAIMHRYAQYKGYDVSVGENTNILSYDDFDNISEYAIPSMQYAVGSGLMKGKTASTLNPLDNATRAEIAAILNRFIEADK